MAKTRLINPRLVKNFITGKYLYKPAPIWIDFRVTSHCNQRCTYCGIPDEKYRELTADEIKTVIDKIKDTSNWVLVTGGEPLLRKDIGEIINYIKGSTDMGVILNSNLLLIKKRFNDIKRADGVFFSLDGKEKTHDKHRLKGSYKKVMDAIKFLSKKKYPMISMTVIHRETTIEDVEHVLKLSECYSFVPAFQLIRHYGSSKNSKKIDSHNKEGIKILDYLIEQSRKGRVIMNSTKNLETERAIGLGINKINCYSGRLFCYINCNGDVGLCFSRPKNKKYLNLKEESVSFKDALKRLEQIRPTKKRCAGCTCMAPIEFSVFSLFNLRTVMENYRNFKMFKQQNSTHLR